MNILKHTKIYFSINQLIFSCGCKKIIKDLIMDLMIKKKDNQDNSCVNVTITLNRTNKQ